MTCAADGTGTDGCSGDSGSPLTHRENGVFTLYGMNSWSDVPCAKNGKPGAYARVSRFLSWIKHVSGVVPEGGDVTPVLTCDESDSPAPAGHHLDKQNCNSDAEFAAGKCRGCEKLCLTGSRYAEDEGIEMACSCCDVQDCSGASADGEMEEEDDMNMDDDKDDMDMDKEDMSGE